MLRYILGPILNLPDLDGPPAVEPDPAPPVLLDAIPDHAWDPDSGVLAFSSRGFDPSTHAAPVEGRVVAIPEGSEWLDALDADALVAAGLPDSVVELPAGPEGFDPIVVPLPAYQTPPRHLARVVFGFRVG